MRCMARDKNANFSVAENNKIMNYRPGVDVAKNNKIINYRPGVCSLIKIFLGKFDYN